MNNSATNFVFGRKYSGNPLASGLIHAYKMEELSGLTIHDSIGSADGTMAASPNFNQTGKINKAIRFINQTHSPNFGNSLEIKSFPFAYKFWINIENVSLNANRGFLMNPATANYCGVGLFYFNQTVTIRFGNNGGRFAAHRRDYTTSNILTTGWHQIILNVTAFGVFELFINGSKYTGSYTTSGTATTVNLTDAIYEMMRFGSDGTLAILDEFYFWNRTLSVVEVADLYTMENAGNSII